MTGTSPNVAPELVAYALGATVRTRIATDKLAQLQLARWKTVRPEIGELLHRALKLRGGVVEWVKTTFNCPGVPCRRLS
jgi:hypothetical protein